MADETRESRDALKGLEELRIDPYAALDLTPDATESDIRRAYRKGALKYHPDKNAGNSEAIAKFHALSLSHTVLSDPSIRAQLDGKRHAQREKEEREAAFEGRRRQMKDDLERRESGAFKRKRDDLDAEELRERELRRLAEDGRRRRRERDDDMLKMNGDEELSQDRPTPSVDAKVSAVAEIYRTIKVRFSRDGRAHDMDKDTLSTLFSRFGKIENIFLLKDKRQRLGDCEEKTTVGTGVVVFASIVGAHAAVADATRIRDDQDFELFDSVFWASDKEPDFLRQAAGSDASAPPTPSSTGKSSRPLHEIPGMTSTPVTPLKTGNGLRKTPSFASFSSASLGTPKTNTPVGVTQSPSLEELTMIRLKNAERKRLEEQIRRQEAAEGPAEVV